MENNHKLGLYVSYYLSRFDKEAYQKLGLGNQEETHNKIGELLLVKPHTVKNWRDEFDPLFGHRAGWYQRPMNPSRIRVVQALEDLNEVQVQSIVRDILSGKIKEEPEEEQQLLSIVTDERKDKRKFILRTPTGNAAENFFIQYFHRTSRPKEGVLIDCRDLGCGYDFKIESASSETYIEVKGMADIFGGVLFTDKEWQTAIEKGKSFFLCIVKNINNSPDISFIQNPSLKIKPRRNIYTTIQVSWSVTENELNKVNDRLL